MERSATEATTSRPFLTRLLNTLVAGFAGVLVAALFLASDKSSFVNGVEFFVGGGMAQV